MSYDERLIDSIVSMLGGFANFGDLPAPTRERMKLIWQKLDKFSLESLKATVVDNGDTSVFAPTEYEVPLTFTLPGVIQLPKGTLVNVAGFNVNTEVLPINKPVAAFYTNIEIVN